jgi:hypothetical protein
MKTSELIELLSDYPDYEIKVPCNEGDLVETTTHFPIEICEHTKIIYLG